MAQNEGRTLRRAPIVTRLVVFVLAVVLVLLFGLLVHGLKVTAQSLWPAQVAVAANRPVARQVSSTTNAGQLTVMSGPVAAQTVADEPQCTPANYRLPTALDLAGLPVGLTVIEDSPQRYDVYGNSAASRLAQLQRCAPVGEYAGAASYRVSWSYGFAERADGQCAIVRPRLGLHLTMILPTWKGSGSPELTESWHVFSRGLTRHEQQHQTISRQHVQRMFDELTQLPPQACTELALTASRVLHSGLDRLQAAQQAYDAATEHGATQGALL